MPDYCAGAYTSAGNVENQFDVRSHGQGLGQQKENAARAEFLGHGHISLSSALQGHKHALRRMEPPITPPILWIAFDEPTFVSGLTGIRAEGKGWCCIAQPL